MEYERFYHMLFNAITDTTRQLEAENYGLAREILYQAQTKAEDWYLEAIDSPEVWEGEVAEALHDDSY